MGLTGERGGGPVKPGLPVGDLASGLWAAIALLAALQGRAATGQGCHVDFSMLDGQIALLTVAAARYFALGEVPPRLGTEHPGRVPSASFRCADGGYLHVTASDQHWLPLCRVLGLAEWGGHPALAGNSGRVRRRDEVMQRLAAAIATRRRDELGAALDAAGVPQGPIRSIDEVLTDEHAAARGLVQSFVHPRVGEFPALRTPFKFAGWDDPAVKRPPLLGEHTEAVLTQRLGLSAARIAELREAKAI
jgi:crotonobetainyl-CoA:carnitine CoA-transferase CaiB-like acyl-CoA transferase